jgi:hypothetical protein
MKISPIIDHSSISTPISEPVNPILSPKKQLTSQEKYKALHPMEKKRRVINKWLRKLCGEHRCLFLESWRCVQHKTTKEVNLECFADDGLHLNDQGITAMSDYIEGNVQRLLPAQKQPKRRRQKSKARKH